MKTQVHLVQAFTKNPKQGNPAGVVIDAHNLTEKQMQKIASNLNFSESAFVLPSSKADFRIRFFTPKKEVDICGHATIASFWVLLKERRIQKGKGYRFETKAGVSSVVISRTGLISMTQHSPEFFEVPGDKKRVASLFGIPPSKILDLPIQTVSTGTPKTIVPVDSLKTLLAIRPDFQKMIWLSKKFKTKGYYAFTSETKEKDSDYHARQFNPMAGVNEDPVTGIAAGALIAYLRKNKLSTKKNIIIEQGYSLKKPGKMFVSFGDKISVGGFAVVYGVKMLTLS